MNSYQRIFGTGPRGTAISVALLVAAYILEPRADLPPIHGTAWIGWAAVALLTAITAAIVVWSVRSLPPSARGTGLCTSGAFHFFLHPLYGAMLTFFNFGLAAFLDNWIYVAWAALQHPIWHWNVAAEERLMRAEFPAYEAYAARTGRFVPRLASFTSADR